MSGQKIIDGLKDAVAGNFARVTIEGQTWVRLDACPVYDAAPDMLAALKDIVRRNEIQHWFNLDLARAAIAKARAP